MQNLFPPSSMRFKKWFLCLGGGWLVVWALIFVHSACKEPFRENPLLYPQAENVIIVVIDGPRFTDSWGNTSANLMPFQKDVLRPQGTFFPNFYNDGSTWTNAGHTAIVTGVRQVVENSGQELPKNPSLFQYFLKHTRKANTAAWIVASKGKLSILANTTHPAWNNLYQPAINCGLDEKGQGYRDDSITVRKARHILQSHKPNLMLINLKEPDVTNHSGVWSAYLQGITDSDRHVHELWKFLQKDPHYKDKTALLITNDHGRHTEGVLDGFVSHGDKCDGCQHISLLALGPDFSKGETVPTRYSQVDLTPTVAHLLRFPFPQLEGQVIPELMVNKKLN